MAAMKGRGRFNPDLAGYPLYNPRIPHYYGDLIRQFMVAAAVYVIVALPFYTDSFTVQMPLIVVGCLILVCLAALTSPHNRLVMLANAAFTGSFIAVFEIWALAAFREDNMIAFVLRQFPVLLFLFAFYFSIKTLRSMIMGLIGQEPDPLEFSAQSEAPEAALPRAPGRAAVERETPEPPSGELPIVAKSGDLPPALADLPEEIEGIVEESEPNDQALDALGNPAAEDVIRGDD